MTILLKRVYEPMTVSDGFRVLVDRIWPRGLSKERANVDLWMRDIAPSTQLRKWFDHDPEKWPEFRERYLKELDSHSELLEMLLDIERDERALTLLFAAKDDRHNNAVVILSALERLPAHSRR